MGKQEVAAIAENEKPKQKNNRKPVAHKGKYTACALYGMMLQVDPKNKDKVFFPPAEGDYKEVEFGSEETMDIMLEGGISPEEATRIAQEELENEAAAEKASKETTNNGGETR